MKHSWIEILKSYLKFIYDVRGISSDGNYFMFYDGVLMSLEDALMLNKTDKLLEASRKLRETLE